MAYLGPLIQGLITLQSTCQPGLVTSESSIGKGSTPKITWSQQDSDPVNYWAEDISSLLADCWPESTLSSFHRSLSDIAASFTKASKEEVILERQKSTSAVT